MRVKYFVVDTPSKILTNGEVEVDGCGRERSWGLRGLREVYVYTWEPVFMNACLLDKYNVHDSEPHERDIGNCGKRLFHYLASVSSQ
jgi:hypothetical protein